MAIIKELILNAEENMLFWRNVSDMYSKFLKVHTISDNNGDRYFNNLTELFGTIHKHLIINDYTELDFIVDLGLPIEELNELVKQSYTEMVATKDTQHMATFCNVVLNIMDKFHRDCINTTKRILFTNMAMIKEGLQKNG